MSDEEPGRGPWHTTPTPAPPKGRFGDASPNSLEGFGINVQHLSLAKSFRITERFRTTLTGAFSNLMNHPHFQGINTNITNPNPGMFTGTRPNYEPEKQSWSNCRVGRSLHFNAEDYIIVAITKDEVRFSAKSNEKKWTIKSNAAP